MLLWRRQPNVIKDNKLSERSVIAVLLTFDVFIDLSAVVEFESGEEHDTTQ